jgi:hypothetical protein
MGPGVAKELFIFFTVQPKKKIIPFKLKEI